MKITLPAVKRDDNGQVTRYEVEFILDTSAYSEYRFKRYFKDDVKYNSLAEFASAVSTAKNPDLIEILQVMYCFLESDHAPTFKDFLKLFDYSIAGEILEKLTDVLNAAFSSATKN